MEVPPTSKGSHLSRESQFEAMPRNMRSRVRQHSRGILQRRSPGDQRALELCQPDGKREWAIQIVSWVGQAVTEGLSFQQWVHIFRQGRLHSFQDCRSDAGLCNGMLNAELLGYIQTVDRARERHDRKVRMGFFEKSDELDSFHVWHH